MLLTRLIQGLGALSLAHLAIATEGHFPKANKTEESHGADTVEGGGYDVECWGCGKTKTVTQTEWHTKTVTDTETATVSWGATETAIKTVTVNVTYATPIRICASPLL
jgi:hypothetical protein